MSGDGEDDLDKRPGQADQTDCQRLRPVQSSAHAVGVSFLHRLGIGSTL